MNRLSVFAFGCLLPLLSIGEEIVVSTAPERHAPAVSRCECRRGEDAPWAFYRARLTGDDLKLD